MKLIADIIPIIMVYNIRINSEIKAHNIPSIQILELFYFITKETIV